MKNNSAALKVAHKDLSASLREFAKLIILSATDRVATPDEIANFSIESTETKMKVFRKDGWCYMYDDAHGVCRFCTAEEDQGAIYPG